MTEPPERNHQDNAPKREGLCPRFLWPRALTRETADSHEEKPAPGGQPNHPAHDEPPSLDHERADSFCPQFCKGPSLIVLDLPAELLRRQEPVIGSVSVSRVTNAPGGLEQFALSDPRP